MSLKNGNTVALERRMDLASLFCMIGRHGPAVALAVVAILSVLAGFIIYRTVRGKRRKATAAAAAADGDSKSPGVERDASVIGSGLEQSPKEQLSSVESTADASDESSSDMKVRHRRTAAATASAAEREPLLYSPPQSDIQIPDNNKTQQQQQRQQAQTTSDDTEETTVVLDTDKVADAGPNLQRDTHIVAEMELQDAGDSYQSARDDTIKDTTEEVRDNESCMEEPELIDKESHEEKVFREDVIIDKDVSDEKSRQEEEAFRCASDNEVWLDQAADMNGNVADDRLQDNETISQESNLEEPIVHVQDVPVTCISYGKDEEFEQEEHHPVDHKDYSSDYFSPEEEEKIEHQQEPNLLSSQQDQYDYLDQEKVALSTVAAEERNETSDFVVLPEGSTDLQLTNNEVCDNSNVAAGSHTVENLTESVKSEEMSCPELPSLCLDTKSGHVEAHETLDETAFIPAIDPAENLILAAVVMSEEKSCPDTMFFSQDQQSVQTQDNDFFECTVRAAPELDEHPLQSDEEQHQSEQTEESRLACNQGKDVLSTVANEENNETGEFVVLAEGSTDPHMINNEAFDKFTVAAGSDIIEDATASVKSEEIPCPELPSLCLDDKIDHMETDETSDERSAALCDNVTLITAAASEDTPCPDMLSFSQDQQSVQTQKYDELSECTACAAPEFNDNPLQPDQHQIEQTDENALTSSQDKAALPAVADEENSDTGEFVVLAEESPELQLKNNEATEDNSTVGAGCDITENQTVVVKIEEMSHPQLPYLCQDEKTNIVETFDEMVVISATGAAVSGNVTLTTPELSEEISRPDTLPFPQDQQIAQTQNNDDCSEFNISDAPQFDDHPPQTEEQQNQVEQTDERELTCHQEKESLPIANDEENRPETELTDPVTAVDNTDDAKAQNLGIVNYPDLLLESHQQEMKDEKIAPPLDKNTDLTILDSELPSRERGIRCESSETVEFVVSAEKSTDLQMINNECFDKSIVAAGLGPTENLSAPAKDEEMSCPLLSSKSDHVESDATSEETMVISDAAICDNVTVTAPLMSEEISRPDMLSFYQDQQSVQTESNDLSDFTVAGVPVITDDLNLPSCQIHLLSFEQSEPTDHDKDGMSSPGVGEESGISSMAVSPDVHGAGIEFDMAIENMMPPTMQCEERREAQHSLFADCVAVSVINEDTAGMMFGPDPSHIPQQPHSERTDWAESYAANEDMFGHEVEDRYHRAVEEFAVQIATSPMSFIEEIKEQRDVKTVVEVVEIKKEVVSVPKKAETEEEKEKEEDYNKTNISIMEATMDNNEWITESNQVLPWMNLSVPPLAQDLTKTEQLPTDENQHSSSLTDAACTDTDVAPSTAIDETSTLPLVDETTESNKKVVAVQPMPQNVNVTFRIHYVTHSPYQTVAVTGNQQELGNWKEFVPLERAKDGHWATVISLPAESHVEWKFVLVDKGEVCRWEECGNRLLDTGFGDDLLVHKWWGFL